MELLPAVTYRIHTLFMSCALRYLALCAVWEVFKRMWWCQASIKGHNKRYLRINSIFSFHLLLYFFITRLFSSFFFSCWLVELKKCMSIDSTRRSFYGKFKEWEEYKRERSKWDEMKKVYNLYVIGKHVEPAHIQYVPVLTQEERRKKNFRIYWLFFINNSLRLVLVSLG